MSTIRCEWGMWEHEGSHAKTDFGGRLLAGWAMGGAVSGDGLEAVAPWFGLCIATSRSYYWRGEGSLGRSWASPKKEDRWCEAC
jgi:hypothetical protein